MLPREKVARPAKELSGEEKVLASISHLRLRQLVQTAHSLASKKDSLPWIRSEADYLAKFRKVPIDAYRYRYWVWQRLQSSDLAERIPHGRQGFPDILDAMREPWRSLERFREPKDNKQLLRHIGRHLDWYLDPLQTVKPPIAEISGVLAFVVAFAVPWVAGVLTGTRVASFFIYQVWFAGAIYAVTSSMLGRRWGRQQVRGEVVYNFHRQKELIGAAELYYYLAAAYRDSDDEQSEDFSLADQ
jgi:hypothetical protein